MATTFDSLFQSVARPELNAMYGQTVAVSAPGKAPKEMLATVSGEQEERDQSTGVVLLYRRQVTIDATALEAVGCDKPQLDWTVAIDCTEYSIEDRPHDAGHSLQFTIVRHVMSQITRPDYRRSRLGV